MIYLCLLKCIITTFWTPPADLVCRPSSTSDAFYRWFVRRTGDFWHAAADYATWCALLKLLVLYFLITARRFNEHAALQPAMSARELPDENTTSTMVCPGLNSPMWPKMRTAKLLDMYWQKCKYHVPTCSLWNLSFVSCSFSYWGINEIFFGMMS